MLNRLIRLGLNALGLSVKRRKQGVRRQAVGESPNVTVKTLMHSLHGEDIYQEFDFSSFPDDRSGWGGDSPAFAEILSLHEAPLLIIEVGSWKGASAITMADILAKSAPEARLLCIDTWLGALEFRTDQSDPERFQSLQCRHGYPQVYYQFLANVCRAGHQGRIVPFPIDSASAALWLMQYGLKADAVYIDGSHEEEAVYQDLLDYSAVLTTNGVIFGDDWSWAGVRSAVERFAREEHRTIRHIHDKWLL